MKKAPLTTGKQSKELKCITNVQVLYNHEPGISIWSIACSYFLFFNLQILSATLLLNCGSLSSVLDRDKSMVTDPSS